MLIAKAEEQSEYLEWMRVEIIEMMWNNHDFCRTEVILAKAQGLYQEQSGERFC